MEHSATPGGQFIHQTKLFFLLSIVGFQKYRPPNEQRVIHDHNVLAKLFLEPKMVKFEKIDDTSFDAYNALSILESAKCFSKEEMDLASQIKDVRNKLAHPDFKVWNDDMANHSFNLMFDLIDAIPEQETAMRILDKNKIVEKLSNLFIFRNIVSAILAGESQNLTNKSCYMS